MISGNYILHKYDKNVTFFQNDKLERWTKMGAFEV